MWDVANRVLPLCVYVDGMRVFSQCNVPSLSWYNIAAPDNSFALTDETRWFVGADDEGARIRVSVSQWRGLSSSCELTRVFDSCPVSLLSSCKSLAMR